MDIKSYFLHLSLKQQVIIVIIVLTIYSVFVIVSFSCSFFYEVIKKDYNNKKLYFYDRYKDFIESCFFYHNFYLMQYEEIIKRMQRQTYSYHQKARYYNFTNNFNTNMSESKVLVFDPNDYENDYTKAIYKESENLFYYCYYESSLEFCNYFGKYARSHYDILSSIIWSHDISNSFHIPGYDIEIMSPPFLINANTSTIFSFNSSYIYEDLIKMFGNFSNFNKINYYAYYKAKIEYMMHNSLVMFNYYYSNVLFMFDHLFEKTIEDMKNREEAKSVKIKDLRTVYEFVKIISGYYTFAKFPEDKLLFISYSNNQYYYIESRIIDNSLYYLNNKLSEFLDISFIALNYENNTIISPELCISFLLKQYDYQIELNQIIELYNKIIKGKSNITNCFMNEDIFNEQLEINDVYIKNISFFLTINNTVNQGLVKTGKFPYYFMKYSYPNYSVLKEFRSDYYFLDQVNFYLLTSFKEPIEYSNIVLQVNTNCFLLALILIAYFWIICLFVNFFIYHKVINQIIEPFNNLQEAIKTSSIKDDKVFKYEYDDSINELFLTSKELLIGHADVQNDKKNLNKFNILSSHKDKQKITDNNTYLQNLIIDNDMMSQLMQTQQNMMDFSKNIKINEELTTFDDIDNTITYDDNIMNKTEDFSNKNNPKLDINKIKEKEIYIKLYRICEYIYYFQNKIEKNYINIINNVILSDNKSSSISKASNNLTNSIELSSKLKKTYFRGNSYGKIDENAYYSINMLDNNDISYLWYMEAKKKKNKSLNFQVSNNYQELFADNIFYENNFENNKK